MAIRIGADATSTNIAQLKALGCNFVCRYLSDFSWKVLTKAEAQALSDAQIDIVSNWENGTNDCAGGFAQGVAYATRANQQHLADGGPADRPIYFSVDEDVDPVATEEYFRGIVSVLGVKRVGAYASTAVLEHLKALNLITYTWRTMSLGFRGGAGGDTEFNIEQTGQFNAQYDRDAAGLDGQDDFGQWRVDLPSPTPAPAPAPSPSKPAGWAVDVKTTQAELNRWPFSPSLVVDGDPGPKTDAAIRTFQTAAGLISDGIPGPITHAKLTGPYDASWPVLKLGSVGQAVKVLQQAVERAIGVRLNIDGNFGPITQSAVKTFQSRRGLVPDGVAGAKTNAAAQL